VEPGCSNHNETKKKKESGEGKRESSEQIPSGPHKQQEGRYRCSSKKHNKPELHDPATIHPTLSPGNQPPDFCE